MENIKMN